MTTPNSESSTQQRPLRVLHVVDTLNVGGAETWLVQILERMDRRQVAIDVMVQHSRVEPYEKRVKDAGAEIYRCLEPARPIQYGRNFYRLIADHGPYHAIHSHIHAWSGFVLRLAHSAGIPTRIAHSRNAIDISFKASSLAKVGYYMLMKHWLNRHMTHGLAVSSPAAVSLFGPRWQSDPRCQILPSSIDLEPFSQCVDSQSLRRGLGLPSDAVVIGHIGRFVTQKNHAFLLRIFEEAVRKDPQLHLLLIGKGPLAASVRKAVTEAHLHDHVHFLGVCDNVPQLMLGAMDMFVFPSFNSEGLPRVVNEAQAAGLPCLFPEHLAPELDVVHPLIHRLPLNAPTHVWTDKIISVARTECPISQSRALDIMRKSALNIDCNVHALTALYQRSATEATNHDALQ